MRLIFISLSLMLTMFLSGQDTLTFEECLSLAVENSPRLKDRQVIDDQGKLSIENIKTSWYPSLTMNGKATYQSDVISLALDIPGIPITFPEVPREQFGVNLDVRQTIYDGGMSKQKKKYEQASVAADIQKVEVDLNKLKEQVTNLYFSILILQENRSNLEIAFENLKAREKTLQSAVNNGIAENNDLQVISVETLKLLQSMSELDAVRQGAVEMLATYLGKELDEHLVFATPYIEVDYDGEIERPELQLFDLQSNILNAASELTSVQRMPQFYAFGQAGLGRPGYNMLSDKVDTYYLVGAGVQWKIWDWNSTQREKQILEKKKQLIEHSRESFTMNVYAGMEKEMENMKHFKNTLSLDDKMLEMRMEITSNAASKVDNGIMNATDYLQVLNQENQTRINRTTHKLQLLKAIASYKLLNGSL